MTEKQLVAEWAMAPKPGYECNAIFYDDGSAEFFDEPARHRDNDKGNYTRRVLFGVFSETDRHLSDEVCRYTYPFHVPTELLPRIVAAASQVQITEDGECISDVSKETEAEIDSALNAIFWSEINFRLTEPLDPP